MTDADRLRTAGLGGTSVWPGPRGGDRHHHIVCRQCGAVTDVDRVVRHAPCPGPVASTWARVGEPEVTFRGLCAACQRSGAAGRLHPAAGPRRRTGPGQGVAYSSG